MTALPNQQQANEALELWEMERRMGLAPHERSEALKSASLKPDPEIESIIQSHERAWKHEPKENSQC